MRNKIKSIREKVPQIATLPDGLYVGTWGGHIIELEYRCKIYELETEDGVKGINITVMVQIEDGIPTFETVLNRK